MISKGWCAGLLMVLALAVVSCKKPITAVLDQSVDVHVGQAVHFAKSDLDLFFRRVVSDSRCPRGVECISAGEVTITFEARIVKGYPEPIEARLAGAEASSDTTKATLYDGYRIWLVGLEPYPVAGTTTDTTSYVATIVVSKR